jgi:hypothetical protein
MLLSPTVTILTPRPSGDRDAARYIAAVEAADGQALEAGVVSAYRELIAGLKTDGNWNALRGAGIMAGARTLTGALVPLVGLAPVNNNFVGGDYVRKTGIRGAGATKWLDIRRANNADLQNSKHIASYVSEFEATLGTFRAIIGSGTGQGAGNGLVGFPWNATDIWNAYANSVDTGTTAGVAITDPCLMAVGRGNATELVYAYNNGIITQNIASQAPTSGQNYLLRSQEFENGWTLGGLRAFGSGSVVNAVAGPIAGGSAAEQITEDSSTGAHQISRGTSLISGPITFSCYVKSAVGSRNIQLLMFNSTDSFLGRLVIEPDGTIVSSLTIGTVSATDAGGGWWRLRISATSTVGTSTTYYVRLTDGTTGSYTGDNTSAIYIWGAQLSRGLDLPAYLATTSSTLDDTTFVFRHPSVGGIGSWHRQMWYSVGEFVDFTALNTRLNTFRTQLDAAI